MELPLVYIETSIPSFYYETRPEPQMVARRQWTREWWERRRQHYDLVTSQAVLNELGRGDYPGREDALRLMADARVLLLEPPIADIVDVYVARGVMPRDPTGDALHLALASHHGCDFLLTWNCTHLANANKFPHIRRVNALLSLGVPALVTPLELLGGDSP